MNRRGELRKILTEDCSDARLIGQLTSFSNSLLNDIDRLYGYSEVVAEICKAETNEEMVKAIDGAKGMSLSFRVVK